MVTLFNMAHFTALPAELQIDIFNYLQPVHVKAARAVSRIFRDNATPALFRSIVACPRYQALGAFQNISLHSIYSAYPREIVFDGTLYDDRVALSDRIYYSLERRYPGTAASAGSHWARRNRWKRFQALYKEQQMMRDDGVLFQSLARGLENMQNISSIVYSPRQHHIPVERKILCDLLPRGAARGASSESRYSMGRFTPPDHPFRQLISAIFLTGHTGIRQLTVKTQSEDDEDAHFCPAVFSLAMFTFPGPKDLLAGKHLFLRLARVDLSVHLNMSMHGVDYAQLQQLENLAKLLETAKDLTHLSLTILDLHSSVFAREHVLFGSLGLQALWPRLRSLSVEGISANKQDVLDMIARHKDTLRALHLADIILCTGAWEDIVNEVVFNAPAISTFTLHRVYEGFTTFGNMPSTNRDDWKCEGHLRVGEDGERHFVDDNPDKKSVYSDRTL
ncbi:mating-type switching swi10 [Pyrenophora seminiperda CCB06]|uniref:Mating-type switching swi10 n=1 Tax=Pyrenophora seminiperda CCB06 TaxID=1302712 RepID=A0A3M7M3D0_9PLEO|nr:mating-type switching swi10 [Pyrenophora seminiperda CCB06]